MKNSPGPKKDEEGEGGKKERKEGKARSGQAR